MIFDRSTDGSRESVDAAFEEARMLGHDSLGDEDLLLGILHADGGMGAEALRSLGVTLEGVREGSEQMLADALTSIGISLEQVRREAGETFDMGIPPGRKIPLSQGEERARRGAQGDEEARGRPPRHRARPARDTCQRGRYGRQDAGTSWRRARSDRGWVAQVAGLRRRLTTDRHETVFDLLAPGRRK